MSAPSTEDGPPAPLMMTDGTSGCEADRLKRELGTRFGYTDFKSKLQERAVVAINGGMYSKCVCMYMCLYCHRLEVYNLWYCGAG